MILIHTSPNAFELHNIKNVLDGHAIECEIRGEFRRAAVGELPVNECWVELWIVDDTQEEAARRILADVGARSSKPWDCPECGETLEGQFDHCWKCQGKPAT